MTKTEWRSLACFGAPGLNAWLWPSHEICPGEWFVGQKGAHVTCPCRKKGHRKGTHR